VVVRDVLQSTYIGRTVESFQGGGTRCTGERRVANGEGLSYLRARRKRRCGATIDRHRLYGLNNLLRTDTMGILAWIVVGLVAGVLASLVMGGTGYGIIGDIVIGIVGAFIGGWLFSMLGIATPFGGMGGTIFVAFIGAVVLLFILRLIRGSTRRV
jgi:uncharacterized membrane protein YeaQ/YmgE (transglycosylase-associated protein family)